jgi:hypothetical protein
MSFVLCCKRSKCAPKGRKQLYESHDFLFDAEYKYV